MTLIFLSSRLQGNLDWTQRKCMATETLLAWGGGGEDELKGVVL